MKADKNTPNSEKSSPSKRVTYSDIAAALGVSKMTISYSLRDDPRISEITRHRVQEKAKEMNYQPDPMLSALAHYRHAKQPNPPQGVLAWVNLCHQPEKQRKQKLFKYYWEGAKRKAHQLGFQLEEFTLKELSLKRMHTIFKSRGIKGIILSPTPVEEEPTTRELSTFPWNDYALIKIGESLPSLNVDVISSAQVSNTILAFEKIREKGYQRIAFVGSHLRHRLFSAGYLWAQQALPLSQQLKPLFLDFSKSTKNHCKTLDTWVKSQSPDAIIAEGFNLLGPLEQIGYRIPSHFGLVSLSKFDNPINAGIDQNPEEIGSTAVLSLTSLINESNYGLPQDIKETLIKGHWVNGSMLPNKTSSKLSS